MLKLYFFVLPNFELKNAKISSTLRHFKDVMNIFTSAGMKKQGRNQHISVSGGRKNHKTKIIKNGYVATTDHMCVLQLFSQQKYTNHQT